jgi:hypothetical protein
MVYQGCQLGCVLVARTSPARELLRLHFVQEPGKLELLQSGAFSKSQTIGVQAEAEKVFYLDEQIEDYLVDVGVAYDLNQSGQL